MPLRSKRADIVLCGVHPKTGDASYVVIELKQWTDAVPKDGTDDVITLGGYRDHLHPGEQVRRYCVHLTDFVAAIYSTDRETQELLQELAQVRH